MFLQLLFLGHARVNPVSTIELNQASTALTKHTIAVYHHLNRQQRFVAVAGPAARNDGGPRFNYGNEIPGNHDAEIVAKL